LSLRKSFAADERDHQAEEEEDIMEAGEEAAEVSKPLLPPRKKAEPLTLQEKPTPAVAPEPAVAQKPAVPEKMPATTEEWRASQDRLFGDLPKLPDGWIRMKSKTKGLIYYYNFKTGESSKNQPVAGATQRAPPAATAAVSAAAGAAATAAGTTAAAPMILELPQTVAEWTSAQERLFGHYPKLPPDWIRMKSKSKGLLYFYNTVSGESSKHQPTR